MVFAIINAKNIYCRAVIPLVLVNFAINGALTKKEKILILLWTADRIEPFIKDSVLGHKPFLDHKCEFQNCFVTTDHSYLSDVTDYDVILFSHFDMYQHPNLGLPKRRSAHQIYIFLSSESAVNYPIHPRFNNFYNLTWTYKLDSDIRYTYISINDRKGNVIGPNIIMHWMDYNAMKRTSKSVKSKLSRKKIAAAWFVSHCNTNSQRSDYIKQLNHSLNYYGHKIDVFGQCGNYNCPKGLQACYELIETFYYFYMAFENAFSEDYVTEKLLTALKFYAVPVVLGGANYSRFMPNGMYLDANGLKPAELALQMDDIIRNPKEYYDMFRWRRYYNYYTPSEKPETDEICQFCAALNNESVWNMNKIYPDISDWYIGKPTAPSFNPV